MVQCTVIKLKTVDQRLTAVQQPVLASGDVGTVRVEYALDSYWDGYTASGTFYTGKKPEDVYEQQLTEGACVIPWEVLQEDGVLYIGLRGVDAAGLIKTAAPVRYRIEKGSPIGSATAKGPTPDVYQQMLESMKETEEIAQSVRDDADNGEFIGERGPAGPAGVYVGTEAPTNGETVWIDTDAESDAQIDVVAKVGQVLVVKAVDAEGHPTELQAVDFPKAPAANWNANEGEEGHIEGRTHYVDEKGVIHKLDNKYIDADWMATSRENIDNSIIIPEQKLTGTTTMWDKRQMDIQPGITYDVHINDVVYPCVAFNEDGICLGNNPSLTKNNLPFCIYWAGGSATGGLFFTNGALGSSVYLEVTGHSWTDYNTMPDEFLPKSAVKSVNGTRPDDNGNVVIDIPKGGGGANIDVVASVGQTIIVEEVDADGKPTKWKAAELQERTHWEKGTKDVETLAEVAFTGRLDSSIGAYAYTAFRMFTLKEGHQYKVIFDGVEYGGLEARVATLGGITAVAVGNFSMVGGGGADIPFVAVNMTNGYAGFLLFDGNEHTAQIFEIVEDVQKIPTKFVPAIEEMRILGAKETDIVPLTTFKLSLANHLPGYQADLPTFELAEGKTYTVIFDGTTYTCETFKVVVGVFSGIAIGNTMFAGGADNGMPFAIAVLNDYMCWVLGVDDNEHTVHVIGEAATYHKIPKGYLEQSAFAVEIEQTDDGYTLWTPWEDIISAANAKKNIYGIVHGTRFEHDENGYPEGIYNYSRYFLCASVDVSLLASECEIVLWQLINGIIQLKITRDGNGVTTITATNAI